MSTRYISWGVKAAGSKADNLTTVLKYGRLSVLEPSRPDQAYNRNCFIRISVAHTEILSTSECHLRVYNGVARCCDPPGPEIITAAPDRSYELTQKSTFVY